jgi:predicted 3-demethylubiquinone-9 3-methyltransferase (glyoxalase superfamily)
MVVSFELDGRPFTALNGGSQFRFSEAVSCQIECADQAEVDRYWETLSEGGEQGPCGWLKDRFGLSWRIVPSRLYELLRPPPRRGGRRPALEITRPPAPRSPRARPWRRASAPA